MSNDSPPNTESVLKNVFESGLDSDPEVRFQQCGKELVNRIFMMMRNGRVHDLKNNAVLASIEALKQVLDAVFALTQEVAIVSVGDSFYLNRTLLKPDFSSFENFRFLSAFFKEYQISGFRFETPPNIEEIQTFLGKSLGSSKNADEPNWLGHLRVNQISVVPIGKLSETEKRVISVQTLADPHYLMRLYLKTVLFLQDFITQLEQGELGSVSRLQRCIHEFIDAMGDETNNILGLASIRSKEDYLSYHSVNVALLSLLVGRELGLNKHKLSDLGASALLHDIGKVQISEDILDKKVPLSEEDWAQLRKSNTYSLMQLIRLKGFNESALRRMLVAYEHTLAFEQGSSSRRPTLLSRIVSIAHCFDAMTTAQSYRDALLPHEAIKILAKDEGSKFDPSVFRVFVSVVTPYPPGTVVLLTSKEVAVVVNSGKSRPHPKMPKVRCIYDANGTKLQQPTEVDLSQDTQNRTIHKTLDPNKYGLNPLPILFPTAS